MNSPRFRIDLTASTSRPRVAIDKFFVSTLSHRTDAGTFGASVTVSSGQGSGSHHRVFRFQPRFASAEAAHLVALTQGWLQTCHPRPALC